MTESDSGNGTDHANRDPSWWDQSLSESWASTKDDALAEWHLMAGQSRKIEKKVAERALAFGHGAGTVYSRFHAWGVDLEQQLKNDWIQLGRQGEDSWDDVKAAVQHQWARASRAARAKTDQVESATAQAVSGAAQAVAAVATAVSAGAQDYAPKVPVTRP
jgi:hypothetical protein